LSVVLVAILVDLHRDFPDFAEGTHRLGTDALCHTLNKLTDIATHQISRHNPELAKSIVDAWLPLMLQDAGIEVALQQVVGGQWQDIVSSKQRGRK